MKLNFEEEQEQETASNEHMKIPQGDQGDSFYNEQFKTDEIYNLKISIKFIKILSIISIIFCIIFTIFQVFQDFQFTTFQKQINKLKTEIEELKSNNKDIINYLNQKSTSTHTEKYENKNKDCRDDNKLKTNDFSAETIILKEKFKKEITFIQQCMTEIKVKIMDKVDDPKITILIPSYKKDTYINRLIQSIQQQKLKELDIIFVEDISEKTVFPKLDEISKRDKRITIIKNDNGMGLLNSYIKGIINVKTKYMLFLEEEDMLLPYLNDMYTTAQSKDNDIYDFSFLRGSINGITYESKIQSKSKFQPEISESYYNQNFIFENPLLNKIIKTEIIKNATKTISKDYLEANFDLHVDSLLYICLCMYAKSYESYGDIYGEYHLKKDFQKTKENIEDLFESTLYLVEYIYGLKYDYAEIFNQRALLVINLINWPLNYNIKMHIDIVKTSKIINMFINNKDISEENKRQFVLISRKIKDRIVNK